MLYRTLACIALVTLLQSAAPLQGQPLLTCPTQGTVIIGHFSEGRAEIGEFCRYLVRNGIHPVFQNLGSIRDAGAAKRAEAALEAGTVHVLWLGTSALGILASSSTQKLKVGAVTDFPVIDVISTDPKAVLADASFAPAEAMVKEGRSLTYADTLFIAIDKPSPRCLGEPVQCQVRPRPEDDENMFIGSLKLFLEDTPSGAVVVASPTFLPKPPDPAVSSLLYLNKQSHLVGIPPATVRKMQAVHGMYAEVSIPRGHYVKPNNPSEDIPTAADPRLLVSGTPPEVAERVRDLVIRINKALLDAEPRVSREHLKISLQLVRDLGDNLSGRVVLHDEYTNQLLSRGLPTMQPLPSGPIPFPIPFPFPGPPSPSQPKPSPCNPQCPKSFDHSVRGSMSRD